MISTEQGVELPADDTGGRHAEAFQTGREPEGLMSNGFGSGLLPEG
jgi:hypothetical protein